MVSGGKKINKAKLPCSLDFEEVNVRFTNFVKGSWVFEQKQKKVVKRYCEHGPQSLAPLVKENSQYTHVFVEIE